MAYFVDRNQMKVINFIPVQMVSSQPQRSRNMSYAGFGYVGGLGISETDFLPKDARVEFWFKPGPGVTPQSAADILNVIRSEILDTRKFGIPESMGWGEAGTLKYTGKTIVDTARSNQIYDEMFRVASKVAQRTGKPIEFTRYRYARGSIDMRVRPRQDPTPAPPAPPAPPSAPPAVAPYTASVRDLQRRLNTAGQRPRLSEDGRWGEKTKGALEAFAASQSITLPALDSGPSYRKVSATEVIIPGALWAKLPVPTGGQSSPPSRRPPSEPDQDRDDTPPPPRPVDEDDARDFTGAKTADGGIPWMWIGAAVAGVAVVGLFFATKKN